jgi:hypothetical protein
MPIFVKDNNYVLFVHVPKTGGTAIELFFERNGFKIHYVDRGLPGTLIPILRCSPQHYHSDILTRLFDERAFRYIFMTVRNPIDRIISEFKHQILYSTETVEYAADINEWILKVFSDYANNNFILDNHIRPQADFWIPGCHVFKQESGFGDEFIAALSSGAGTAFSHLPVGNEMNGSVGDGLKATLSPHTIACIKSFYARDFEMFDYIC